MKGLFRYRNIKENKYTRNIFRYGLLNVLFLERVNINIYKSA